MPLLELSPFNILGITFFKIVLVFKIEQKKIEKTSLYNNYDEIMGWQEMTEKVPAC